MAKKKFLKKTANFDLPSPCYIIEEEGFWTCKVGDVEVSFRGGPDGVDPVSVQLARHILPNLAKFEAEGRAYLHAFVDPASFHHCREYYKIKEVGEWHLIVADFGRRADLPANGFELRFTLHEDVYGLWSVSFRYDTQFDMASPMEFRRTEW